MKKIVKILVVFIFVLVLSGCSYQIVKKANNDNKAVQPINQVANSSDKDILDLQSKCADQAAKLFKEQGYDSIKYADFYSNHWNKKLSTCFILIQSMRTEKNGLTTSKFLANAFENKIFGQYLTTDYSSNLGAKPDCEMYKDGSQESLQICSSQAEFDNFVKPYMEE
jgi:uncharacterized protein YceK